MASSRRLAARLALHRSANVLTHFWHRWCCGSYSSPMQHRVLRTVPGVIYLLWLALYISGPDLWHHCPQHSTQSSSRASADHGAPVSASGAHASSHSQHGQREDGSSADACCCPGPACDSSASALVTRSTPDAFRAIGPATPIGGSARAAGRSDALRLPFAIPPPSRLTS